MFTNTEGSQELKAEGGRWKLWVFWVTKVWFIKVEPGKNWNTKVQFSMVKMPV